jgi:formate-dependent phosphoribosylglycinamide formyltransferase (GAR transformylase)
MTKKRALLVGSSFSAVPLFFALKKYGLEVVVCGNLRDDPCHQYADGSVFIDYSKGEALLEVVEDQPFDYLVPTCNDYSYMAATWVAARHPFPGFDSWDTATILHTKNAFRDFTSRHQLPAPRFVRKAAGDSADLGDLRLPVLVKPVDAFSGRGMTKVERPEDVAAAIDVARQSSRSGDAVVEEFVDGTLHSHSAFFKDQKVVVEFFVDEFCTVYPYQVNCSNHPSRLSDAIRPRIRSAMERLAQLLGMGDGLLHTQIIVNGDDFWIIECMRRGPGDLYGTMIELSTGVDYADLMVRPYMGLDLPTDTLPACEKFIGRHTISVAEPMIAFTYAMDIPQARDVRIVALKDSGQKLAPAPYDKLAIIFAQFPTKADMLDICPTLDRNVTIQHWKETP